MAKLFLEAGDNITVSDPMEVFGSTGAETLKVNGIGVSANANVDRVEFGGRVADYTFLVEGNVVSVFKAGVKVATLGTADTTELAFTDGTADLVITGLNAVTLGGTALPTITAAAVVPATLDATDKSTIVDPTTPNFTLTGSATATESGSATYTVNLSAVQATTTTVEISALADVDGDAVADIGALALSAASTGVTLAGNTLTFAPGATSATLTLPVVSDTTVETGEKVTVTLANPGAGLALGAAKSVTTTLEDAPAVVYTLTPATTAVAEGTALKFTLTASSALPTDQVLTVSIVGNSNGGTVTTADTADFTTPPATVTLPAGATTLDITLTPTANDGIEGSQGFTVSLLQGSKAFATSPVVVISDATTDTTGPVFDTTKIGPFNYAENQIADAVVATVVAADTSTPVTYSMTSDNFAINATTGAITLTAAGLASTLNNFDDTGTTASNTATLKVTATDAASNKTTQDVVVNVTNVDDDAPVVSTAVLNTNQISITFNETLDSASIPDKSLFSGVKVSGGTSTALNITSAGINGSSVILTLDAAPATGSAINVNYAPPATGSSLKPLQDVAGNDVAAINNQTVTIDNTAPTLATTAPFSPADDAANVAVGVNLEATFSETIQKGTGIITVTNTVTPTDIRSIDVTSTAVTFTGNKMIIDLPTDLATAANYYVNIPGTAVKDVAGNFFTGISNTTTWNFATPGGGGTTGQTVVLTQSANNVTTTATAPFQTTANDDQINGFLDGSASTFSPTLDTINGGDGVDTLTAYGQTGANSLTNVSNVEKLVFRATTATTSFDVSTMTGFTGLTSTALTNEGSTQDLSFLNIGSTTPALKVQGATGSAAFNFTSSALGSGADTVTVTVDGFKDAPVDSLVLSNGIETLTLNAIGSASAFGIATDIGTAGVGLTALSTGVDTAGYAGATTVNVTGTAGLVVTNAFTGAKTVNLSANSGGASVDLTGNTNAVTVTGGAGNDGVTFTGTSISKTTGSADSVNLGDGTGDVLGVAGALTVADYTTFLAAVNSVVSNTEGVMFTDTQINSANASPADTTSLAVNDYTNGIKNFIFNDATMSAGVNGTATIGVTGFDTTNSFTFKESVLGNAADAANLASASAGKTANVTLEGTTLQGGAAANALDLTGAGSLVLTSNTESTPTNANALVGGAGTGAIVTNGATVELKGNTNILISSAEDTGSGNGIGFAAGVSVNAATFGGSSYLTLSTSAGTGDNFTGGTGIDQVFGLAGNDSLSGMAGADMLFGGAGQDTLLGGDGDDTLVAGVFPTAVAAATADSLSGGAGTDKFYLAQAQQATATDTDVTTNAYIVSDFNASGEKLYLSQDTTNAVPTLGRLLGSTALTDLTWSAAAGVTAAAGKVINIGTLATDAAATNVAADLQAMFSASAVAGKIFLDTTATNFVVVFNSARDSTTYAAVVNTNATAGWVDNADSMTLIKLSGVAVADVAAADLTGYTTDPTTNAVITGATFTDNAVTYPTGATFLGTAGNDTFVMAGLLTNADVINGSAGSDTLTVTTNNTTATDLTNVTNVEVLTIANSTTATAYTTADTLVAAGATLTVTCSGTGAGTLTWTGNAELDGFFNITGGAGADTIIGGSLADTISGGAGTDSITGGAGNDTINLTESVAAADIVVFAATAALNGADTITGFAKATDIINWVQGDAETAVAAGAMTTSADDFYQLGGLAAGSADSAAAVAAAVTAGATWTAAAVTAWIAVSDDNSTAIYAWTDVAATNGVQVGEITLVGTIDAAMSSAELATATTIV